MKRKKFTCCKWRLFFLCLLLVWPAAAFSAPTAGTVTHSPPDDTYIPGFRINLDVQIADPAGFLATRCYFKTKQDKNFGFTNLFDQGSGKFTAVLPAPWVNSEEVHYLFVAVNKNKQVTRTPIYVLKEAETKEATTWQEANEVKQVRLDKAQDAVEAVETLRSQLKSNYSKKLPKYQTTDSTKTLNVQTELSKEMVPLNGFYDTAVITETADALKYGFLVDGLYASKPAAAAEVAAAPAAKTGMSTLTKVGIGVLAVGGGTVAVVAATDDDDDDAPAGGGGGGGVTPPPAGGGTQITQFSTPNGPGTQTAPYGIEIISHNAVSAPLTVTYNGTNIGTYTGTGTQSFDLTGIYSVGGTARLTLTSDVSGAELEFHFTTNGGRAPSFGVGYPVTGSAGDYIDLITN